MKNIFVVKFLRQNLGRTHLRGARNEESDHFGNLFFIVSPTQNC